MSGMKQWTELQPSCPPPFHLLVSGFRPVSLTRSSLGAGFLALRRQSVSPLPTLVTLHPDGHLSLGVDELVWGECVGEQRP